VVVVGALVIVGALALSVLRYRECRAHGFTRLYCTGEVLR